MLESLYRTHRPWLVQWCTAMTGNPASAEDLVQDTWLRRTAKNRFIDLIRRAQREPEPDREVLHQDDHTWPLVTALCAQLPPEEQALFTLRYFEGYNATELGELFDLSPSTVRAKLASARRKLKLLYNAN